MGIFQSGHYLKPWLPQQKLSYLSYAQGRGRSIVSPTSDELGELTHLSSLNAGPSALSLFTIPNGIIRRIGAINASQAADNGLVHIDGGGEFESCLIETAQHLVKFGLVRRSRIAFRMFGLPPGQSELCGDAFGARTASVIRLYGSGAEEVCLQDALINVGPGVAFVRWQERGEAELKPKDTVPCQGPRGGPRLARLSLNSGEGVIFSPAHAVFDLDTLEQEEPAVILIGNDMA